LDESRKQTTCELTCDELAVIAKIREAEHGTVEVQVKKNAIVNISMRRTFLPPSLEDARQN
jgi:hypothetical protein